MASPVVEQSPLIMSGKRFAVIAKEHADAFKLVGGVLVVVISGVTAGVAWAINSRKNLELGMKDITVANVMSDTANQLAIKDVTMANSLAIKDIAMAVKDVAMATEKAVAAQQLETKCAELRMERRILDFTFHGDFEKMRDAQSDVLAKMLQKKNRAAAGDSVATSSS